MVLSEPRNPVESQKLGAFYLGKHRLETWDLPNSLSPEVHGDGQGWLQRAGRLEEGVMASCFQLAQPAVPAPPRFPGPTQASTPWAPAPASSLTPSSVQHSLIPLFYDVWHQIGPSGSQIPSLPIPPEPPTQLSSHGLMAGLQLSALGLDMPDTALHERYKSPST